MPRQRAETGGGRGTKRSASSASEGHGENTNAPQRAPKRRVQAEFLAPEDVRLRVAQDSLDLRIERTDREDDQDDTTSLSWLATTHNRGVVGHGSTDLIRRQLDQIDALAPDTMLEFVIHPVHERAISVHSPDNRQEGEVSPAPTGLSRVSKLDQPAPNRRLLEAPPPRTPTRDPQMARAPVYDHSGSPDCHLSPEYPPWFQGWGHLDAKVREWEARNEQLRELATRKHGTSAPKVSHRYPTRSTRQDNTPRLIVTIKRVPAQAEATQQTAPEEEVDEEDGRGARESSIPRTRSRRSGTRRGMFKTQPLAEEPEELDQEDSDPCDSLLDFVQDEEEDRDDRPHDTAEQNDDGNSSSSDDSSSTDISADSSSESDDTEKPNASGRSQGGGGHRKNSVRIASLSSSDARNFSSRYPVRERRLTRPVRRSSRHYWDEAKQMWWYLPPRV